MVMQQLEHLFFMKQGIDDKGASEVLFSFFKLNWFISFTS